MLLSLIIFLASAVVLFVIIMFLLRIKYFYKLNGVNKKVATFGCLFIWLVLVNLLMYPLILKSENFAEIYSTIKNEKEKRKVELGLLKKFVGEEKISKAREILGDDTVNQIIRESSNYEDKLVNLAYSKLEQYVNIPIIFSFSDKIKVRLLVFGIIFSFSMIIISVLIIILFRELSQIKKDGKQRDHIFEYNNILDELNKNK